MTVPVAAPQGAGSLAAAFGRAVARCGPLSQDTLNATVAAIHDWAAVTVAGAGSAPPRLLAEAMGVTSRRGQGTAELVGTASTADPATAALVNGTAAHSLEFDDIYSPGLYHPGAPTIAAALAVAQHRGASGMAFLRGVALGYEVGNRIATAINPGHYRMWHTTGTVGAIGAAVAVAVIGGGDARAVAHAVALAASMSAGLQQTFRSDAMGKPLHAGHAAQAGVVGGLAACHGMTGALDVLEGEAGLVAATGGRSDPAAWLSAAGPIDPGTLSISRTSVKPYPCCGHAFAAIDGALRLRAQLGPDPAGDIDTIEVATYETAIAVAGDPDPQTGFEARFSTPYVVACALRDGVVTLRSFDRERLQDPAVRALMRRVCLTPSAAHTAAFPGRRGATVSAMAGGHPVVIECPDRKGDPANPLTKDELRQKFDGLARSVFSPVRADALYADIAGLADVTDMRGLRFGHEGLGNAARRG